MFPWEDGCELQSSRPISEEDRKACAENVNISSQKEDYGKPRFWKFPNFRRVLYEKFLYNELYSEYVRTKLRETTTHKHEVTTEYRKRFYKYVPPEDFRVKRDRANDHPLYCDAPITIYNKSGDNLKSFSKKSVITRSSAIVVEQFG